MSSARKPERDEVAAVVAALLATRKYRNIAPGVIDRIARESLAAAPRRADAVKRAKTKLHQIHSAFVAERDLAAAERLLVPGSADPASADLPALCAQLLARHASTAERAPDRAALYRDLFALTGPPASVVDLGCGFHPFALPWMGLARDVAYHALDLDLRMVALVDGFLRRIGQRGGARACDLLGDEALPRADVALLMKLLPTLERQQEGASRRLLARLADAGTRVLVLSFPTASLGRREKGMAGRYEEFARTLLADHGGRDGRVGRLATRDELFFVATPHAARRAR